MRELEIRKTYRFVTGATYYVRHKSVHAETGELMVVYSEIDLNSSNGWGALKNETYVMPYDVFINNLEK